MKESCKEKKWDLYELQDLSRLQNVKNGILLLLPT
jgi:hypothetical protein